MGAFYTDMIKTLRITSVIAAILAGVFFVFPVIYGVRSDERVDEYLELPSVREKFENAVDSKAKTSESRESPLVMQAEAFALYLNPVKPAVPKTPRKGIKTPGIASKVNVTPKFPVYATIVCPENPNLSQALIDEPGTGRHWVRQSSMVGHLFIEQVEDGLVVVKSGQETYKIEIEKPSETEALNKTAPTSSLRRSPGSSRSTPPASGRAYTNIRGPRNIPRKPQLNNVDEQKITQFVDTLENLKESTASDDADSELSRAEKTARIEQLITKFKSSRVSAEEAKKLGNMGEKLKGVEKNSNPSTPDANEGKVVTDPPKSDKSAEK